MNESGLPLSPLRSFGKIKCLGSGALTGSPTEAGLLADAEAAYAFAAARYPAERIVLWGESLGSGVAVALGAGEAPLDSLQECQRSFSPRRTIGRMTVVTMATPPIQTTRRRHESLGQPRYHSWRAFEFVSAALLTAKTALRTELATR